MMTTPNYSILWHDSISFQKYCKLNFSYNYYSHRLGSFYSNQILTINIPSFMPSTAGYEYTNPLLDTAKFYHISEFRIDYFN
jgi:hypothetical protein